ncbi:hypothetical protein CRV15_30015 (plasmid) [Streptomyces clavuligerus]|uniref:Ricin B lectin n=1 Tax=Streptomyces clavuligerus TaxID=1901 RepID=D5SIZ3_STRCL|nr:RICIN domain-containing protein [Streptomyces clavuligerus]EFG03886.1 Ricin B lectin [Streptomyces clavuligerus]QCS09842.1 hypothetical protein CRV15_30015 [Streptomyces clavuligerus]QPJ98116.1 hypothetical protein GE265_34420 [Streptomyces clavuligerus]WDN56545.1 RICIN domain-containing protein [Streptomyces clavuligerus]
MGNPMCRSRSARALWVATAALLLSAATVPSASAGSPPLEAGTYTVRTAHAGKCLGPQGDGSAGGEAVVQQPCDGRPSQRVTLITAGGDIPPNSFFVRTAAGLCWNVKDGLHHQGTPIIQWPCGPWSNEVFTAYGDRHPWTGHMLRTHTTRPKYWNCLHIRDASAADDAPLIQHPCNSSGAGGQNDTLHFTPA